MKNMLLWSILLILFTIAMMFFPIIKHHYDWYGYNSKAQLYSGDGELSLLHESSGFPTIKINFEEFSLNKSYSKKYHFSDIPDVNSFYVVYFSIQAKVRPTNFESDIKLKLLNDKNIVVDISTSTNNLICMETSDTYNYYDEAQGFQVVNSSDGYTLEVRYEPQKTLGLSGNAHFYISTGGK